MIRAKHTIRVLASAIAVLALIDRTGAAQSPATGACALVTDSELETVLGSKVPLKADSIGDVQTCSGEAQNARVLLRLFTRTGDPSGKTEQAGIDEIKKMGVQVDTKTSGGVMCMTGVPPASMAAMGFGTTCTVISKAPRFAVIEVTAKTQANMVPMETLRAVAEKMAGRF